MAHFRLLPTLIAINLALPLGIALAQPVPENEATLLRETLRRRYAFDGEESVQILIGRIFPLPANFPLPEEAQIIGSVIRGDYFTEILFQIDQSPEEVYSFYQQQLLSPEWQIREPRLFSEGFIMTLSEAYTDNSASRGLPRHFCSTSQPTIATISAQPQANSSTTMVQLSFVMHGFESRPPAVFDCLGEQETLLPALFPPANVIVHAGGYYSGGIADAASDALIETDLDAEALINHYASQLQQVGWIQVGASEGGLSRWNYQDEEGEDWQGVLLIEEIQETPNQYAAFVQIRRSRLR